MKLDVTETALKEVLLLTPKVFGDARGYFFESFNAEDFAAATGLRPNFVQDNQSRSSRGVLRGLHYQVGQAQGKLVRVLVGEIFDVVVDLRRSSTSFGQWLGTRLSADNKQQLWIPEGFGHGFVATSETAEIFYKATDYYSPAHEHCVNWSDPTLAIAWPVLAPVLSAKDAAAPLLADAVTFD